jgi:diguanylate cyclase (GGDEF)-like protein/PAS domain S-box-containing protein
MLNSTGKTLSSFWPAIRISLGLALIAISVILVADMFGIVPNDSTMKLESRKTLSESFAIQFSALAASRDVKTIRSVLSPIVKRNEDLLSAGFRNSSNSLVFQIGNHDKHWGEYNSKESTTSHVVVPIYQKNKLWGSIELRFNPLPFETFQGYLTSSIYKLLLFVFIFGFLGFLFFIMRTLRQLDPSAVIPARVNAAFDTLAEGVLILDEKENIVLANSSFAETLGRTPASLIGLKASGLDWQYNTGDNQNLPHPWTLALESLESVTGETLLLTTPFKEIRTLVVNCAPILDNKGWQRGVITTFDDVTEVQQHNVLLQETISELESSQKEIKNQNKELNFLATRDPLTGCLNRRSFNDLFQQAFEHAKQNQLELSCLMVDIDHFKSVNDNYGHTVGDEVIKLIADILHASTRNNDLVGRYGGEEFCVVLPGLSTDQAVSVAERIRLKLKEDSRKAFESGPHITGSLGVSNIEDHAVDPLELTNQADKALYIAKETGRNRVIKWLPEHENQTTKPSNSENLAISEKEEKNLPKEKNEVNRLQIQVKQLESYVSTISDKLHHEQNYDPLTSLPNQALLFDRIKGALIRCAREKQFVAMLVVDIHSFNQVNNTYGRSVGDQLLKKIADRLSGTLRKTDGITLFSPQAKDYQSVSRLGADEFGILISDFDEIEAVTWVVKRIFDNLNRFFILENNEIQVNFNVGISLFPDDADSPEQILSHAVTAKQSAKKLQGENNFQFYDTQMHTQSIKQLQIEKDLRRAIKNQEFELFYQPKLNTSTGIIQGVEALIRWNHPEKGLVLPYEFIEIAEKRGLITEIGDWVLKQACWQAKAWLDSDIPPVKVAINLSSIQLREKSFADRVLYTLEEFNLPPQYLELEVTETILMENVETAVNILNRLHCRGIGISIDDFGTGYSSLSYLKNLPINTLKIDRSFITDLLSDEYDKNIVSTIISMAHGMNLQVVAEGVETREQFELLKEMSCDEIQGYLLSKPVDNLKITTLLQTGIQTLKTTENFPKLARS